MSPRMLRDLSVLFSLEALEADERGEPDEAERLWDIAEELHERMPHTQPGREIR